MEENLKEGRTVSRELVGGDNVSISRIARSAIILYISLKGKRRDLLKNFNVEMGKQGWS